MKGPHKVPLDVVHTTAALWSTLKQRGHVWPRGLGWPTSELKEVTRLRLCVASPPGLVPELRLPGPPQRGDAHLRAPEPRHPDGGRRGDGGDAAHPVSDAPPAGVQGEDGTERHHAAAAAGEPAARPQERKTAGKTSKSLFFLSRKPLPTRWSAPLWPSGCGRGAVVTEGGVQEEVGAPA